MHVEDQGAGAIEEPRFIGDLRVASVIRVMSQTSLPMQWLLFLSQVIFSIRLASYGQVLKMVCWMRSLDELTVPKSFRHIQVPRMSERVHPHFHNRFPKSVFSEGLSARELLQR